PVSSTVSSSELLAGLRKFSSLSEKHDLRAEGPSQEPDSEPPLLDEGFALAQIQLVVIQKIGGESDRANRLVDLLCMVAQADGRVDGAEEGALAHILDALLGSHLHEAVVKHLIRSSLREIAAEGTDKRMQAIVATLVPIGLAEETLALGIAIALASAGLSTPERAILKLFATQAGITAARFSAIVRRISLELANAD
ncbi:MAG: TerB family tellurite resistance protein, partial [Deltaproteobacteria bacterium]